MPKLKDLLIARARRRCTAALLLSALLAAAAATAAGLAHDDSRRRDAAVRQALAAAPAAAQAIFSYDYRSFDASTSNARTFVTGDFAAEYAKTTAALKSNAIAEQAIVRAEVSATGVVTASPAGVDLLLYVDQYRRNTNITGEKVDQNRVVLTLVPAEGTWKVAHAVAL
jgi:Mce-associated membrane protein